MRLAKNLKTLIIRLSLFLLHMVGFCHLCPGFAQNIASVFTGQRDLKYLGDELLKKHSTVKKICSCETLRLRVVMRNVIYEASAQFIFQKTNTASEQRMCSIFCVKGWHISRQPIFKSDRYQRKRIVRN